MYMVCTTNSNITKVQVGPVNNVASVMAMRQLLLISGDVEENPGPLGQGTANLATESYN